MGDAEKSKSREEIENLVKEVVREQLSIKDKELSLESRFSEDLEADSLDTVELVMAFEEKFDCTIPDEHAEKIKTLGDAVDFIEKNQPKT